MTLNKLLKSQRLISEIKKFKTKEIFDIVVYGSLVKGKEKTNDVDIAVILNTKTDLNQKLKLAESLNRKLGFLKKEIDVKVIDISDFLDPTFIARQAILAEGFSLINKKFLHKSFGFKVTVLFKYSLVGLSYSQKKMFYYALKGRRQQKGLLKLKNGKQISNCVIEIPIEHSEEFKELFCKHNMEYEIKKVLEYII